MQQYALPNEFSCPVCGCIMDAARHAVGGRGPIHDDFTVCANCAEFLVYVVNDGRYSLRVATEEDAVAAESTGVYKEILHAQELIKTNRLKLKVRWR